MSEEKTKEQKPVKTGTKILISGASNTGKTTLLKTLKDAVVFNYDNKSFPYDIPHRDVFMKGKITTGEMFHKEVKSLLDSYEAAYGKLPTTLVIDSVSTIVGDLEISYTGSDDKSNGFTKWTDYKSAVHLINDVVNVAANKKGINVILITHAQYNMQNNKWEDTTKGGFAKKEGGFLSTVDYAICIDVNSDNSRVVYLNNAYRMSRNTFNYKDGAEFVDASEFNLQEYLEAILEHNASVKNLQI